MDRRIKCAHNENIKYRRDNASRYKNWRAPVYRPLNPPKTMIWREVVALERLLKIFDPHEPFKLYEFLDCSELVSLSLTCKPIRSIIVDVLIDILSTIKYRGINLRLVRFHFQLGLVNTSCVLWPKVI